MSSQRSSRTASNLQVESIRYARNVIPAGATGSVFILDTNGYMVPTKDLTLNTLSVGGTATFTGPIGGTATFTGPIQASTLIVGGTATFNGPVRTTNTVSIGSTATFSGPVTTTNTLTVGGTATFTAPIGGTATFIGPIVATTIAGSSISTTTLAVGGTATMTGPTRINTLSVPQFMDVSSAQITNLRVTGVLNVPGSIIQTRGVTSIEARYIFAGTTSVVLTGDYLRYALDVSGASLFRGSILAQRDITSQGRLTAASIFVEGSTSDIVFRAGTTMDGRIRGTGSSMLIGSDSQIQLGSAAGSTVAMTISPNARLITTGTGVSVSIPRSLAVGTTTAVATLDVSGSLRVLLSAAGQLNPAISTNGYIQTATGGNIVSINQFGGINMTGFLNINQPGTGITGQSTTRFAPDRSGLSYINTLGSGLLGIGTTTPAYTLDISGDAQISRALVLGPNASLIQSRNGANARFALTDPGNCLYIQSDSGVRFSRYFSTQGTTVGVGALGVGTFTPAYTLDVQGTANVSQGMTVGGRLFVGSGLTVSGAASVATSLTTPLINFSTPSLQIFDTRSSTNMLQITPVVTTSPAALSTSYTYGSASLNPLYQYNSQEISVRAGGSVQPVSSLWLSTTDSTGTNQVRSVCIGDNSAGFGGGVNDQNRAYRYVYDKSGNIIKVESITFKQNSVGVAGVSEITGDVSIYTNLQVAQNIYAGRTLTAAGLTVNGPATINGTLTNTYFNARPSNPNPLVDPPLGRLESSQMYAYDYIGYAASYTGASPNGWQARSSASNQGLVITMASGTGRPCLLSVYGTTVYSALTFDGETQRIGVFKNTPTTTFDINGSIAASGNGLVGGGLTVSGAAVVGAGATVGGSVVVGGGLTMGGSLTVSGGATIGGPVTGAGTISGVLNVGGTISSQYFRARNVNPTTVTAPPTGRVEASQLFTTDYIGYNSTFIGGIGITASSAGVPGIMISAPAATSNRPAIVSVAGPTVSYPLVFDGANQRVGVFKTAPTSTLDVLGSLAVSGSVSFPANTSATWTIYRTSTGVSYTITGMTMSLGGIIIQACNIQNQGGSDGLSSSDRITWPVALSSVWSVQVTPQYNQAALYQIATTNILGTSFTIVTANPNIWCSCLVIGTQ